MKAYFDDSSLFIEIFIVSFSSKWRKFPSSQNYLSTSMHGGKPSSCQPLPLRAVAIALIVFVVFAMHPWLCKLLFTLDPLTMHKARIITVFPMLYFSTLSISWWNGWNLNWLISVKAGFFDTFTWLNVTYLWLLQGIFYWITQLSLE